MSKAIVVFNKCLKCEKCLAAAVCPVKAIFKVDADGPAYIEQLACYGCGDGVEKCLGKAITIK